MISRTAFTQLRYSAALLLLTVLGLTLVWLAPVALMLVGRPLGARCAVSQPARWRRRATCRR